MRIDTWHDARMATDPEYAKAAELIDLEQKIADLVVSLRVRSGLSQAEVARRAGTTQATISHLENGEANPRVSTVSKVLLALMNAEVEAPTPPTVINVSNPTTAVHVDAAGRSALVAGVNTVLATAYPPLTCVNANSLSAAHNTPTSPSDDASPPNANGSANLALAA